MKTRFIFKFLLIFTLLTLIYHSNANAQKPVVLVDLNFDGRRESEVHDPKFTSWVIGDGSEASFENSGVTFTLKSASGWSSSWYKAGVQNPYYAQLSNDGIFTFEVELIISGLPAGTNSILAYHNAWDNPDNNTFAPVDVYVNDVLIHENIPHSERALSTDATATSYTTFNVEEGKSVSIKYKGDATGGFTKAGIYLNGFELNTSNASFQAKFPFPEDRDEHADIDNGHGLLHWSPASSDVVSHNVYFGTNEQAVLTATPASPEFIANQSDTIIQVSCPKIEKYFWRIDEITTTDTTQGDVWYFIPRRVAFLGAEGYGAYAIGGRGGKVVYVTNLDDSGPGSFRHAVENAEEHTTILFAVSGIITLNSRLVINNDYITVAGQTAPGKGVCVRWAPIGVTGDDLIVQHLRVRLGIGVTFDGMGLTGAESSIVDHCSISWTIDEAFSSRGAKNITLQNTLISEALNVAGHSNYPDGKGHGFAASIGGDIGSFHHNLLAHCAGRNWSLAGGLDGNGFYAGRLDITNNVVYNWDGRTTDGGAHEVNFVNNYYKPGPAIEETYALNAQHEHAGKGTQSYYVKGNVMPGYFEADNTERSRRAHGTVTWDEWVDEPFFPSLVTTHSAYDAYKIVLSNVGATQPVFDEHDIRIVEETRDGTTSTRGSRSRIPGLPDHEKDAGYWEEYPGYERASDWDSDLDGLPDWWETALGTNPSSEAGDFSDPNADKDSDLFTNLEEYLQWMSEPHYFVAEGNVEIDLSQYTRGFTNGPSFTVTDSKNGTANLNGATLTFTPGDAGFAEVTFKVTDLDNSSMSRTIRFFKGVTPEDAKFDYSYYLDRNKTEIIHVGENVTEPVDTTDVLGLADNAKLLWPNPASEVLNVQLDEDAVNAGISITDLAGRKVAIPDFRFDRYANTLKIDVATMPEGTYLLTIQKGGKVKTERFVKR